ncbi:MAG: hypothetical protein Q8P20_10160 [bacterium]|nr:hypothetical protein [bacterium]
MNNSEQNQQPIKQPEKPQKKFYKKWWFWVVIVIVLAISVFFLYPTIQTDIIGEFVKLGDKVNVNINYTFPNPPCSSCNLGIKPTQKFDNIKSDYKRCDINNDCIMVSYSGNPANQCGFTVVPINKSARVLIQSEMDMYFEAYEAEEPVGVCGMSFTSPTGVKCVKRECKIVLIDIDGNLSIEK